MCSVSGVDPDYGAPGFNPSCPVAYRFFVYECTLFEHNLAWMTGPRALYKVHCIKVVRAKAAKLEMSRSGCRITVVDSYGDALDRLE